jgi:glycerol kinase
MSLILAIDQGTTGSTALLIERKTLKLVSKKNVEYRQIFPKSSWVEHNPTDIWNSVKDAILGALKNANLKASDISLIGITNQRETTVAFNQKGEALHNAIVWQDRRTELFCHKLKDQGLSAKIKKLTGLTIDPYFSATKMNWLLNESLEVKSAEKNKDLRFGTIDTFLLYKLTNGQSYYTDTTNASRTMLMNLETGKWDTQLLEIFGISSNTLPEIKPSFSRFGKTKNLGFLPDNIEITCLLGDQQSALFGQNCIHEGESKCTYGTGAFMLLNTGKNILFSDNGLLTTVAYSTPTEINYALEGSTYIAGAAVQWLRDALGFFPSSAEVEALALKATEDLAKNDSLLFLPFFTGLGTPYWISEAKAAIIGITRNTDRSNLSLACLEGISLSINDLINAFEKDFRKKMTTLKVDGGASSNELLLKLQASVSKLDIIVPEIIETTGYGAGLGAVVGSGDLEISELKRTWKKSKTVVPSQDFTTYLERKAKLWNNYIKKLYL